MFLKEILCVGETKTKSGFVSSDMPGDYAPLVHKFVSYFLHVKQVSLTNGLCSTVRFTLAHVKFLCVFSRNLMLAIVRIFQSFTESIVSKAKNGIVP